MTMFIKPVNFVLMAILLCVSATLGQDDDEIIRVDSSIVILNVTVTNAKGNPVFGLRQNQFQVFEDGKEQKIEFFATEETPFAAVILIDTSGSMEQRVSLARSAAIRFLEGLRFDDVTAIYNFDSKVSLVQDFSNSRDIHEAIFDLKASGWTVLNDAIFKAAQELEKRPEKRRAILVLSDGADTKSARSADKALRAALAVNATIYTVDISSPNDFSREKMQSQAVLKNFAEKTGGRFIATPGGTALREAFKSIVEELGTQYTIGYQPTNTAKDGKWRSILVKVNPSELTVRTRKGYHAPKAKN